MLRQGVPHGNRARLRGGPAPGWLGVSLRRRGRAMPSRTPSRPPTRVPCHGWSGGGRNSAAPKAPKKTVRPPLPSIVTPEAPRQRRHPGSISKLGEGRQMPSATRYASPDTRASPLAGMTRGGCRTARERPSKNRDGTVQRRRRPRKKARAFARAFASAWTLVCSAPTPGS